MKNLNEKDAELMKSQIAKLIKEQKLDLDVRTTHYEKYSEVHITGQNVNIPGPDFIKIALLAQHHKVYFGRSGAKGRLIIS